MIGYHVTGRENLDSIKITGLLGSEWPEDNNFTDSCSNPFDLRADGAVFCFPTLEEAQTQKWDWDNGEGIVILRVEGSGIEFEHYYEGPQIAIRADTATWQQVVG